MVKYFFITPNFKIGTSEAPTRRSSARLRGEKIDLIMDSPPLSSKRRVDHGKERDHDEGDVEGEDEKQNEKLEDSRSPGITC